MHEPEQGGACGFRINLPLPRGLVSQGRERAAIAYGVDLIMASARSAPSARKRVIAVCAEAVQVA